MNSELEKALERYRQKKQEAQSLKEQQRAAQETAEQERIERINPDFERIVTPVLQRFWSENVPQELVDLFDEYAQRVGLKKEKGGLQKSWALKEPGDKLLYYESTDLRGSKEAKERVLQLLNGGGWKNLELHASYDLSEKIAHTHYHFGFSVTSQNPSSVHWWTGGGDNRQISGEYTRTPESLEKVVNCLAEALEEKVYTYYIYPSRQESYSGSD